MDPNATYVLLKKISLAIISSHVEDLKNFFISFLAWICEVFRWTKKMTEHPPVFSNKNLWYAKLRAYVLYLQQHHSRLLSSSSHLEECFQSWQHLLRVYLCQYQGFFKCKNVYEKITSSFFFIFYFFCQATRTKHYTISSLE
jgi:hypothetical protein